MPAYMKQICTVAETKYQIAYSVMDRLFKDRDSYYKNALSGKVTDSEKVDALTNAFFYLLSSDAAMNNFCPSNDLIFAPGYMDIKRGGNLPHTFISSADQIIFSFCENLGPIARDNIRYLE